MGSKKPRCGCIVVQQLFVRLCVDFFLRHRVRTGAISFYFVLSICSLDKTYLSLLQPGVAGVERTGEPGVSFGLELDGIGLSGRIYPSIAPFQLFCFCKEQPEECRASHHAGRHDEEGRPVADGVHQTAKHGVEEDICQ